MGETSTPAEDRFGAFQDRLKAARNRGGWLMWAGVVLALLWWGAAFGGAYAYLGLDRLMTTDPVILASAAAALLIPGLLILVASLFAREQMRSSAANILVLEAAEHLLQPLQAHSETAISYASSMAKAAGEVDKSMNHALTAMRAVSEELGDERQRLESVTYASADNARELAERLAKERTSLEALTRDLQKQAETLNQAIPAQVRMMVDSAKSASEDVAAAEEGLKGRLGTLETTSQSLRTRIEALDTLAAEAAARNESLLFAISRMEEKLEQSRRTVETASRAGELAAAAASTTGDRVVDAVKAALDQARQASKEIQEQSFRASETAADALAKLKRAGEETSKSIRGAKADLEQAAPLSAPPRPAPLPERASTPAVSPSRPTSSSNGGLQLSPSRVTDDDLFEVSADRFAEAVLNADEDEPNANEMRFSEADETGDIDEGLTGDDVFDEDPVHPTPTPRATAQNGHGSTNLSDIIADMEREDRPTLSREDTASELIDRLTQSGVKLADIFKPNDKKKIALSARKGDSKRRLATRQSASRQIERVRLRLRNDSALMALARDFIALEESDALNALESTRESKKNASARLATYLLLDAALD